MSKKKKRAKGHKKNEITKGIFTVLEKEPSKSFNYKQIAAKLGVNDPSSRNQIIKKLQQLKANQDIEEVDRGKFKAVINTEYYTGIIDTTPKGTGYVSCEAFDEDRELVMQRAFDENIKRFFVPAIDSSYTKSMLELEAKARKHRGEKWR